jgi:small subunit ribosomal protein S17
MTEQADNNDEQTAEPSEEQDEQPAEAGGNEEPAAEQPAAPQPVGEAEPAERLSSKERRRQARSTHKGSQPPRSPEERHQQRIAKRKQKAAYRSARRGKERAKAARRRRGEPARDPGSEQSLAPVHSRIEGVRKVRQGVVVSDKADKTITVRIDVARRHRRYQKIVRSSSTLHAHDENNDAHEGDTVRVIESRPLSRSKRWNLVEVLERAR